MMKMIIGFVLGILVVSAAGQQVPLGKNGILTTPQNYMLALSAQTVSGNMILIRTDDEGYAICSDYRSPAKP